MVWLSQPEAQILNGRFVWANWDVEELMAKAHEIESTNQVVVSIEGWLFLLVNEREEVDGREKKKIPFHHQISANRNRAS